MMRVSRCVQPQGHDLRTGRGILHLVLIVSLLAGMLFPFAVSAEELKKADIVTLKSAYIVNFIRFTEWPQRSGLSAESSSTLEIVGDEDLFEVMHSFARQNAGKAIRLSVDMCNTIPCLKKAAAVFLGKSTVGLASKLEALKGLPVLTISDMPGFASQGGMIEIKYQNEKLTFIVNRDAVARAGLYISAQLLQLGEVVESDRE